MPKVLIIDDDSIFLKIAGQYAKPAGYEIVTSQSVQDGLRAFEEHKPELVLLDLYLPDAVGYSAIEALQQKARSLRHNFQLVAVSAGSQEELEQARQNGADQALQKPIQKEQFLQTLQGASGA